MPRKKPQSKLVRGYSAWTKKKLMNEAKNVARWNPWLAHDWMKEATDGLTMDEYELVEYHDKVAGEINAHWKMISGMSYFNPKTFWNEMPAKMITKIIPDDDYDTS